MVDQCAVLWNVQMVQTATTECRGVNVALGEDCPCRVLSILHKCQLLLVYLPEIHLKEYLHQLSSVATLQPRLLPCSVEILHTAQLRSELLLGCDSL